MENQYDYDVFGNVTLTIEQYAQSIRYAGEFLRCRSGLVLPARTVLRSVYRTVYLGGYVRR